MIILHAQTPASGPFSQDILQRLKNYNDQDVKISIYMDPLIETNYYRHMMFNQKEPGAMGYQLRIFSASGPKAKDEAEKARSVFLSKFDSIGAYLVYDSPDYKVYVGDCRSKSEIIGLLNRVRNVFPNAFEVYRRINVSYE
jgi:hypothetical protein